MRCVYDESSQTPLGNHNGTVDDALAIRALNAVKSHEWYKTYYLDFKPRFETYCDAHAGITDHRPRSLKMLELFEETTCTMPQEPQFRKIRHIHNCFSIICTPTILLGRTPETVEPLKDLKVLCGDIWNLFVFRASISQDTPLEKYQSMENNLWDHVRAMEEKYENIIRKGAVPLSDRVGARIASTYEDTPIPTAT